MTAATHTSQAKEAYAYDATGNRTNTGYTTGANNRLLSDGTYSYQYDAEGNRTRRTEIATGQYDAYAWDHHNRLTSVKTYTAAGALTKQVQYTYDMYDRRIGRQVDTDGNGTWDSTRRFVYDGEDIVLAYSGSTASSLTNRYLVGPNTDEILADESVVAGATSAVTWSLADNLGTVRDLVQYVAGNDTTTVVNHLLYDTFGQIKGQTNSVWQPLFAFTGREWDNDAGLYYYRARWYDARVGRFLSEDPIGFAAGDVNLNRYVVNAPTMFLDPSGLEPIIASSPEYTNYAFGRNNAGFSMTASQYAAMQLDNQLVGMLGVGARPFVSGLIGSQTDFLDKYANVFNQPSFNRRWSLAVADYVPFVSANTSATKALIATTLVSIPVGIGLFYGGVSLIPVAPAGAAASVGGRIAFSSFVIRGAAIRAIAARVGTMSLPFRAPVTSWVRFTRFFATSTGYTRVIAYSPTVRLLQSYGWQAHHWWIPKAAINSVGMARLANAGWNLMPLPAWWNNAIGCSGLGYEATRWSIAASPLFSGCGGYYIGSKLHSTVSWMIANEE